MEVTADAIRTMAVFCYKFRGTLVPLTQQQFSKFLWTVLKDCGLAVNQISGNSFRHGGASFVFPAGLAQIIKLHSDWKSSAFEHYFHVPMDNKVKLAKGLSLSV